MCCISTRILGYGLMHARTRSSAGFYVDVAGHEAGGGGGQPVSCEAATENHEYQGGGGRWEEGDDGWK